MSELPTLPQLSTVVRKARQAGHCCFTPGDFCYRWATETQPGIQPDMWVLRSIGFCWLSGRDLHIVTMAEVSLQHAHEIVAWGERRLSQAGGTELSIPVNTRMPSLEAALTERGYLPGDPELLTRVRPLAALPGSTPIPGGYRVTTLAQAEQPDRWRAAYQAAFEPEEITPESRAAIARSPLYRPELDLVALDERGDIAAFALAWFDPESASGCFEPIGCRPRDQRSGLARALLVEGLSRLRAFGAEHAYITTTRRRRPANQLYAALDFRVDGICRTWRRPAHTGLR